MDENGADFTRSWAANAALLTLPAALALGLSAVPLLATFFQRGASMGVLLAFSFGAGGVLARGPGRLMHAVLDEAVDEFSADLGENPAVILDPKSAATTASRPIVKRVRRWLRICWRPSNSASLR